MGSLYRRKLASGHRSRVWTAKFYVNGAPLRVSTGCEDRGEAKKWLQQKEGQVAKGEPIVPRYDKVRYDEIANDLRQDYRTNGSRNLKEAETRLAHLDRHFRGWRVLRIGRPELIAYCQKRQEEGASNATINREIAVLKRMFRLAYEDKKVLRIPPVKLLKESAPRQGFFEPDAYEAVCRHLPLTVRPGVAFAYVTGWRGPSEVLPLRWPQVDFKGGVVRLEPGTTKNREARTFPMFPELRSLLEAQRAYTDRIQREQGRIIPWVFHRQGTPIRSFRKAWVKACLKAGQPGRIPHDLRRTAVRNMVRRGIGERVAMTLAGHKTRSVFDRYNIVSQGDLHEAARKLQGTLSGHTGGIGQFAVENYDSKCLE